MQRIYAAAHALNKATVQQFTVTASGGTGLLIELVNVTSNPALLSAIELDTTNPAPISSPTTNLQLSTDGGATWSTVASNLPLDSYGRGSYQWTAGPQTLGSTAEFRVQVNSSTLSATSPRFAIYNGGSDYYVNDSSTVGDTLTTAVGSNSNSGKSPSSPLADVEAVIAEYNPGPGAVIHVDAGTYSLVHDILLLAANSGLTIQGPTSGCTRRHQSRQPGRQRLHAESGREQHHDRSSDADRWLRGCLCRLQPERPERHGFK